MAEGPVRQKTGTEKAEDTQECMNQRERSNHLSRHPQGWMQSQDGVSGGVPGDSENMYSRSELCKVTGGPLGNVFTCLAPDSRVGRRRTGRTD